MPSASSVDARREIARVHVDERDLAPHRLGHVGDADLRREDRRPGAEAVHDDVARDARLRRAGSARARGGVDEDLAHALGVVEHAARGPRPRRARRRAAGCRPRPATRARLDARRRSARFRKRTPRASASRRNQRAHRVRIHEPVARRERRADQLVERAVEQREALAPPRPTASGSTPSPCAFWSARFSSACAYSVAVGVEPQVAALRGSRTRSACSAKKSSVARQVSMLTGCHQVARAPPAFSSDEA